MNDNANGTIQEHAELRRLLSAWLCEPEHDLFAEERLAARIDEHLEFLGVSLDSTRTWQEHLEGVDPQSMLVEFTRLFEGPGKVPAPLYSSLYIDNDEELVGKSTLAVEAFYAEEGVGVDKELAELPDHAAIELEFSSNLLERALAACASGDATEARRLLDRHVEFEARYLRDWIFDLGKRVESSAKLEVYRTLGERLGQFATLAPARWGVAESSEV